MALSKMREGGWIMANRNGYQYVAKKCLVNGEQFDSLLEGRMAAVLIEHGVKFNAHIPFECYDPKGAKFTFVVDFVFETPQKLLGIRDTLDCLEVAGVLSPHKFKRNEGLAYCHRLRCYCAGYELIDLWERFGLWGQKKKPDDPRDAPPELAKQKYATRRNP